MRAFLRFSSIVIFLIALGRCSDVQRNEAAWPQDDPQQAGGVLGGDAAAPRGMNSFNGSAIAPDAVARDVLAEMNLARTQPATYATFLEELRPYYRGKLLEVPGKIALQTQEGLPAVDEAIAYLRAQTPRSALTLANGLNKAAADHARDQGSGNQTGHTGSDGSSPFVRMERYGKWLGTAGENISYGLPTGREIVLQLIVDDGVPSRGHRSNTFQPNFRKTGIAVGPHGGYRWMCVIDLADQYADKE